MISYLLFTSRIKSLSSRLNRFNFICWNWRLVKILDPKILMEDPEFRYLTYFDTLSHRKMQFISQLVNSANEIWNHLFIIYVLSFHYFCFWAVLSLSYILSSTRPWFAQEKGFSFSGESKIRIIMSYLCTS